MLRKLVGKFHLILGLTAGLVIFTQAITGAIMVFEPELRDLTGPYRTIEPAEEPPLPPTEIARIAHETVTGGRMNSIEFPGPEKSAVVHYLDDEMNHLVYINPHSGDFLKTVDERNSFFRITIELHTELMLGKVGKQIIRFSALIFLIQIIGGIILWWPRKGTRGQNKFKLKFGVSFKRLNYDLHSVLGFYASWIILLTVITGLAWSFDWMDRFVYFVSTGGAEYRESDSPRSVDEPVFSQGYLTFLDDKYAETKEACGFEPLSSMIFFPDNSEECLLIIMNPSASKQSDYYAAFYDQYSGDLVRTEFVGDLNNGQYLHRAYYDLHLGKMWGYPGRILLFIACLVVASLPITGFLIWNGKRKSNGS